MVNFGANKQIQMVSYFITIFNFMNILFYINFVLVYFYLLMLSISCDYYHVKNRANVL